MQAAYAHSTRNQKMFYNVGNIEINQNFKLKSSMLIFKQFNSSKTGTILHIISQPFNKHAIYNIIYMQRNWKKIENCPLETPNPHKENFCMANNNHESELSKQLKGIN